VALNQVLVPGYPLAAWRGPEKESLVIYRTLRAPGANVDAVRTELRTRLGSLPEARVTRDEALRVGGRPAARVDIVAPGSGAAIAPSGLGVPSDPAGRKLIPTLRTTVAVPRERDTVWLVCHFRYPASERSASEQDDMLKRLQFSSAGSYSSSSY
jgi:hypothetical protein